MKKKWKEKDTNPKRFCEKTHDANETFDDCHKTEAIFLASS